MRSDEMRQTIDLIAPVLRSRGVDPDDPMALRQAGAIALTSRMLRDTVWEDWHASSWGLSDGEMMRTNSATVEMVCSKLAADPIDWRGLANDIAGPDRVLPDGRTLRKYAGRKLAQLQAESLAVAELCAELERDFGLRATLLYSVMMSLGRGSDWHGTPGWPDHVEAFCRVVDDAADEHWRTQALAEVGPRPPDIESTADLRRLLLAGPHLLSAEAAEWCVRAGIRYVKP